MATGMAPAPSGPDAEHRRQTLPARLARAAFAPVDIAPLVVVRVAFGALLLFEALNYLERGWVHSHYVKPLFLFKYYGFHWVGPWPGNGMYWHFAALALLAACIMIGLAYRVVTPLFFLGFTYVFLLERAEFQNHHYLICLFAFILIFIPAHRALSADVWRRPRLRASEAPAWSLWWLRFQVAVPYFFGALAKLNPDWLHGEPMRAWLSAQTGFPVIGRFFRQEWMVYAMSYAGVLLDLLLVPALLWRRTRPFAFAVAILFHLMNARLWNIGIFPWLMIGATVLFFPPESLNPGRWWRREAPHPAPPPSPIGARQVAILAGLALYAAVQILVPLRPFLYPGNFLWTSEGSLFSWQMMLRDSKSAVAFIVTDRVKNETWRVDPARYLTPRQHRIMASRPDMLLQFAHFLGKQMRAEGRGDVEVRALVWVSLNGRRVQPLIDDRVDLAHEPITLGPARWIVPLGVPLGDRQSGAR